MDLEVNVIEGLYEQLQDANPNLWQRIINWFSHIWQVIKGFSLIYSKSFLNNFSIRVGVRGRILLLIRDCIV